MLPYRDCLSVECPSSLTSSLHSTAYLPTTSLPRTQQGSSLSDGARTSRLITKGVDSLSSTAASRQICLRQPSFNRIKLEPLQRLPRSAFPLHRCIPALIQAASEASASPWNPTIMASLLCVLYFLGFQPSTRRLRATSITSEVEPMSSEHGLSSTNTPLNSGGPSGSTER